jgi:hypothetical protein
VGAQPRLRAQADFRVYAEAVRVVPQVLVAPHSAGPPVVKPSLHSPTPEVARRAPPPDAGPRVLGPSGRVRGVPARAPAKKPYLGAMQRATLRGANGIDRLTRTASRFSPVAMTLCLGYAGRHVG